METLHNTEAKSTSPAPGWFYSEPNHYYVMAEIFEDPSKMEEARIVFNRLIDDRNRDCATLTDGTDIGPRELKGIDDLICAAVEATDMNSVGLRLVGLEAIAMMYADIIDNELNDEDVCLCCRDRRAAEITATKQ